MKKQLELKKEIFRKLQQQKAVQSSLKGLLQRVKDFRKCKRTGDIVLNGISFNLTYSTIVEVQDTDVDGTITHSVDVKVYTKVTVVSEKEDSFRWYKVHFAILKAMTDLVYNTLEREKVLPIPKWWDTVHIEFKYDEYRELWFNSVICYDYRNVGIYYIEQECGEGWIILSRNPETLTEESHICTYAN